LLAEVEFRDTLRGYDRDEVDTFLEQVGVAIAQLQGRLREAIARAEVAESRSTQGPDDVSTDTITRTLLLAQRTADATVADADADARRMVEEAQDEASRLRSEAQADRAAVLAETENEARQVAEQARRDLLAELSDLETRRDGMRLEVDALDQALQAERTHVLDAVGRLTTLVESGALGDEPAPADQASLDEPDEPDEITAVDEAEPSEEVEAAAPALQTGEVAEVGDGAEQTTPDIDLSDDLADDTSDDGVALSGMAQPAAPSDPPPGASVFDENAGPATQAVDVLAIDDDDTDDVFVQQLRQAVSPTGEGDGETLTEFFDDDAGPRRLFGRNSD